MTGKQLPLLFRIAAALKAAWNIFKKLGEYRVIAGDTISYVYEIKIDVEE